MAKSNSKLSRKKPMCMCKGSLVFRIRAGGVCLRNGWGGGDCLKYLKKGWNRKEGRRNKSFKKKEAGKLGQGVGALKRGAGTTLRAMDA